MSELQKRNREYLLFSNGTEFMMWQEQNCNRCAKAVYYNDKKNYQPKYRCAVQKHIEDALITDGCGNKRDYNATHLDICPYFKEVGK